MSRLRKLFYKLVGLAASLARPQSSLHLGSWAGLVLVLALAGCQHRPAYPEVREHRVFFNDFEQLVGWLQEPVPHACFTTERAHSGRYSVKVDAAHPFSVTYRLKLGQFTTRPRRMRLSAWAWVEEVNDDAQLTCSISAPDDTQGKSKLYTQIYLADSWPYKRWTHVSRDIELPAEISSQAELVVYLWYNSAQHPVYTDDWELTELH